MKRRHISQSLAGLALAAALTVPALGQRNRGYRPPPARENPPARPAQRPQAGQWHPGPGHAGDWLRRYKDLPPAEQERALRNDPNFQRLPPERQQQLRQRLQHFSNMPPEQQQRVLNRMETWEHLTPGQKQQARQIFQQMRQLPPDRRRQVMTAMRDLRSMPPDQRERVIDSDRFKSMFSPQERDMLRGVTRLPLAPPENNGEAGP